MRTTSSQRLSTASHRCEEVPTPTEYTMPGGLPASREFDWRSCGDSEAEQLTSRLGRSSIMMVFLSISHLRCAISPASNDISALDGKFRTSASKQDIDMAASVASSLASTISCVSRDRSASCSLHLWLGAEILREATAAASIASFGAISSRINNTLARRRSSETPRQDAAARAAAASARPASNSRRILASKAHHCSTFVGCPSRSSRCSDATRPGVCM
mmetsp:Transcript_20543/g.67843  ORF Transcript_20543/g.67843 Transcript_20543/m.67843 type:complete len:218 (-) Transcript_20543:270-923(-)